MKRAFRISGLLLAVLLLASLFPLPVFAGGTVDMFYVNCDAAPVVGEQAKHVDLSTIYLLGSDCSVVKAEWRNIDPDGTHRTMSETETFQYGGCYMLDICVRTDDRFTMESADTLVANCKFNGQAVGNWNTTGFFRSWKNHQTEAYLATIGTTDCSVMVLFPPLPDEQPVQKNVMSLDVTIPQKPQLNTVTMPFPDLIQCNTENTKVKSGEWRIFDESGTDLPLADYLSFEAGNYYAYVATIDALGGNAYLMEEYLAMGSTINGQPVKSWDLEGHSRIRKNTSTEYYLSVSDDGYECYAIVLFPIVKEADPPLTLQLVGCVNPVYAKTADRPFTLTVECLNAKGDVLVNWFNCDEGGVPDSTIPVARGLSYTVPGIPESMRGKSQYLLLQAFDERDTDGMAVMMIEYQLDPSAAVSSDTTPSKDTDDTGITGPRPDTGTPDSSGKADTSGKTDTSATQPTDTPAGSNLMPAILIGILALLVVVIILVIVLLAKQSKKDRNEDD